MAEKNHILVVEDDATSRVTLSSYFEKEGYRVTEAVDGEQMRSAFSKGDVDLIMLDIRLPGEDGLTLLREVRQQSSVGVIMVTGKSDEVDRIVALEMGADDYVTKPFNPRELLVRAKNLLARINAAQVAKNDERIKKFSGWSLNMNTRSLESPDGEDVRLTRGEFELLAALVNNPNRVMSRDNLLDYTSNRDWAPNDRTVDVLIGRIRRKIEPDPHVPSMIITVHGVGYVFAGETG